MRRGLGETRLCLCTSKECVTLAYGSLAADWCWLASVLQPLAFKCGNSLKSGGLSSNWLVAELANHQPILGLDPAAEQLREPADGFHTRCFLVPIEVHSDSDRTLQPARQVAAEESEAY